MADYQIQNDDDLIERIKEEKRKFESKYGPWRKEARENYDMVAGDGRQWDREVKAKLEADGKPAVEFNRLATIIDAVSGSEINNRKETTYIPRQAGNVQSQGLGEIRTAAAKWVRDNCDAEDEESDAFLDVLIAGVGCTDTVMDYEVDEEGQILIERKDPLRLGWDASAGKRNLTDRKCNWEECSYSRDELEQKWPDKADQVASSDEDLEDEDPEEQVIDPKTRYLKETQGPANSGNVVVTRFQWYEVDQIYKVASPTGQVVELPEDRFQALQTVNPFMQYAKTPRRRYMQAFVAGNVVLEVGPICKGASEPCKDFSYQFITGKRDRNKGYWYGLVRPGKDPQRWANKFMSQTLHIVNTNAKGGVIAETGAVSNTRKFEEDWSKSDSVNWVNPGGLAKIQPKQPVNPPAAIANMMTFAISSIQDCTGVNLELLGLKDQEQAGILEAQRTQAALTILAPFFANLRLYRKTQGRILAFFIREYISDGRLIRVVGQDGEQFIPLFREPEDVDYEVIVDEAPTARDTKEKTWQVLQPILAGLQQMGVMPPPDVLDYLPVPVSLAQKIKQAVIQAMQNKQPSPQAQAEVRKTNALAEQAEATAAMNYAKGGQAGFDLAANVWQALTGQPLVPQAQMLGQMPGQPPPGMPQQPMMPAPARLQ